MCSEAPWAPRELTTRGPHQRGRHCRLSHEAPRPHTVVLASRMEFYFYKHFQGREVFTGEEIIPLVWFSVSGQSRNVSLHTSSSLSLTWISKNERTELKAWTVWYSSENYWWLDITLLSLLTEQVKIVFFVSFSQNLHFWGSFMKICRLGWSSWTHLDLNKTRNLKVSPENFSFRENFHFHDAQVV